MAKENNYKDARIKALEIELKRLMLEHEFLNAKIDALEIAINEAYLFI
jgi:hypothetical protein